MMLLQYVCKCVCVCVPSQSKLVYPPWWIMRSGAAPAHRCLPDADSADEGINLQPGVSGSYGFAVMWQEDSCAALL